MDLSNLYAAEDDDTDDAWCRYCHVKSSKWKIVDHETHICMEKRVPCTNAAFGCDAMFKRKDLINHIHHCPASINTCTMAHTRQIVSSFDSPPGKFEPARSIIEDNLDLSASLFDQHTLFSQILTMKFFDKINQLKSKPPSQPRKQIKIKSALKQLAEQLTTDAIASAQGVIERERAELKKQSEQKFAVQRYIGGVSIDPNEENIFDMVEESDTTSRPSSRPSSLRSSSQSSRRSRGNGMLDDVTIRQMFRRYLCSPTKNSELIRNQLQIIQRQLSILLDDEELVSTEDESDLDSSDEPRGWQPPSSYRYGQGDRYGLRQYMTIKKEDAETQSDLGERVFDTAEELVVAVLRQLTGAQMSKDGISDSESAGWSHGWQIRSTATQTADFPEMIGITLKTGLRPRRKTFLTTSIPYIGLELATSSVYQNTGISFQCGQVLRRDEIQHHQRDVHNTIIAGLDSWLNERCPMHRHGCTFSRRRFKPRMGNLRHDLTVNCWTRTAPLPRRDSFPLNELPTEVVHMIARRLDGYSMKSLRRSCSRMFHIMDDFIISRGMVEPVWARQGTMRWRIVDFKWRFSNHMDHSEWVPSSDPPIGEHMRTCLFMKGDLKQYRERPAPLPAMAQGTQVKNYKITYDEW